MTGAAGDAAAGARPEERRDGRTSAGRDAADVLAPPHPSWLAQRLNAWGPPRRVAAFARAAEGAGVTPWLFDETARAEDWAYLIFMSRAGSSRAGMMASREATMRGARALARRLARAVAEEHDAATGWIGISTACPFDLHRLVPVPPAVLHQGADHPAARRWLWTHWGTTWPLRQVTRLDAGQASSSGAVAPWSVAFWSADWSPWPALARIRADWPDLTFRLEPRYDNDGVAELAAWRARRSGRADATT